MSFKEIFTELHPNKNGLLLFDLVYKRKIDERSVKPTVHSANIIETNRLLSLEVLHI